MKEPTHRDWVERNDHFRPRPKPSHVAWVFAVAALVAAFVWLVTG